MPGAIPARHLVIEIADFHNKIGHKPILSTRVFDFGKVRGRRMSAKNRTS